MESSKMQSYCQLANYCYACFLVDQQDPEVLCNGLCYQCHSLKWNMMKQSISLETIVQALQSLSKDSKWYALYDLEYKSRLAM